MSDVIGRAVIEIVPDFSKFRKELSQTTQTMTRDMSNQMGKANISGPMSKTFGDAGRKASAELKTATDKGFKGIEDSAKAAGNHIESDMKKSFNGVEGAAAAAEHKIDKEMDQAARQSKASADKSESAWKGSMGKIGGAIAGVAAVAAVTAFTKSSVDTYVKMGVETKKLSRLTGESSEEMSKFRFAAHEVGISGDQLANGFKFLNKNSIKSKTGFNEAGVALFDLSGKHRASTDIFLETADALNKMESPALRSATAQKIFGRAGTELLPILAKGSEGIKELGNEAEKFGLVLSGKQIDDVFAYKKAQRELAATFDGLKIAIGTAVLPILTKFTKWLVEHAVPAIASLREFIAEKVVPAFDEFAKKMAPVTEWLGKVAEGFVNIVKSNAGPILITLIGLLGVGLVGALIAVGSTIAGLFSGVAGTFLGIMGPLVLIIGGFALAYMKIQPFHDAVNALVKTIADFLIPVFKEISGGVQAFVNAFIDGGDEVTSSGFAGFLEGLGVSARNIFDGIKRGVTAFVKAFIKGSDDVKSSGFVGFLEGLGVALRKVYNFVVDTFITAITMIIDNIKTVGIVIGIATAAFLAYEIGVGLSTAATWLFSTASAVAATDVTVLGVALTVLDAILALNPIGVIVVALVALGIALVVAYKKFEPVHKVVDTLWQNMQSLGDIITTVLVVAWNMLKPAVTQVADVLKGIFIQPLIDAFNALSAVFHGDFSGALDIAKTGLGNLKDSIVKLPGALANLVSTGFNVTDMMLGVAEDMITGLTDGLVEKMKGVPVIGGLAEALGGVVTSTFQAAGGWMDIIRGIFTLDPGMIAEGFGGLKDSLVTQATVIIPGLLDSLSNLFSDIIPDALDGIGDKIKDIPILGSLGTTILDTIKTGFDVVGNLADVIAGLFTFDTDKIKEGLGGITSAIGNFLIELPGKLIDYVGDAGELFSKYFGIAVDWLVDNLPTVFAKLKDLPEMIGTFISNLFGGGKEEGKKKGKKGGGGKGGDDKDAGPSFFGGMIESAKNWILHKAGPKLSAAFHMFIKRIPHILISIVKSSAKLLAVVVPGLLGVLFDWAGDILGALPGIIIGLGKIIFNVLKGLAGFLFDGMKWAFDFLVANLPGIIEGILSWFLGLPGLFLGYLGDLGGMLLGWLTTAFNWLVDNGPGILATLWGWISGIPGMLLGFLGDLGSTLLDWITYAFDWIVANGPGILASIWAWVSGIPGTLLGFLGDLGSTLLGWATSAFQWVVDNGPTILQTVWDWVSGIPGTLISTLGDLGSTLMGWFTSAFQWVVDNGPTILSTLWTWITAIPLAIIGLLGDLGALLVGWFTGAFQWVVDNGPTILATVWGWITFIPSTLIGLLGDLGALLIGWFTGAFQWVVDNGPIILTTVLDWVKGIPDRFINNITNLGDKLFGWAKAGFDMIKDRGGELLSGAIEFFTGIPGKLIGALGDAASGAGNFAAKIYNGLVGFINDKLLDKLRGISAFGIKPFAGLPILNKLPELADGGIFNEATTAIIGEAGAEVVIPLTKPDRAKELLAQSGLMDLISKGSPGIAMSAAPSTPDTSGMASAVSTAMTPVVDSAVAALQPVKDWFTNLSLFAIDALKTFGETVWTSVHATFEFFMFQVLTLLNTLTAFIAAWPMTISVLLADTGGLIWLSMAGGMGAFAESFKAVFADLGAYVYTWQAGLTLGLGGLPGFMGGIAGQITAAITGPFLSFASGIWNPFASTLTGALDQIPATANINIPSLTFPTAHEGGVIGEMLPETSGPLSSSEMLVKMQRGEGVIPASVMSQMSGADFEYLRQGDFGERDPRLDSKIAAKFAPQFGGPASSIPTPTGGGGFDTLPASILDGLKLALTSTFTQVKALTEQAFYIPKYLGGVASSAALGGLGFVQQKFDENNKAIADSMGGVGTAFPNGFPKGLPAAIDAMRQVAGKPGSYPALINYMEATGVPFKVISTSRPGATTRGSGNTRPSLHASNRAVDFAGLKPSVDSPELLAIYRAFEPVRDILQELIYSGPGGGFVRNPITRADHHNHVHTGLANGAYVRGRMMAMLGEDGPEVVIPLTRPMRALQLAEQSGLLGVLSEAAGQRAATQGDTATVPTGSGATGSVEVQGLFPGQGNTYNIYGISMAQVIAEIEAREQASTRVNFTRR